MLLMSYEGISHRNAYNDCYCLNENEIRINLHVNLNVTRVILIADDPYIGGTPMAGWKGKEIEMEISKELYSGRIYTAKVAPRYKRLQYYFHIYFADGKEGCFFEDGLYAPEILKRDDLYKHYFKFAWMNKADICKTPKWAQDTIWYQIFPDSFARISDGNDDKFRNWDLKPVKDYRVRYGGNLKGISDKLDYLASLGMTGIYITPIFQSPTNHRYNTTNYELIDPDLGTNAEFVVLVKKAHSKGIKIMIDAVFNHSGMGFFAWQDVVKNGKNSEYYDWYFINDEDFIKPKDTRDGRYYSFAFVSEMPKLNTNNPKVIKYLTDVCKYWIKEFDIDAIRFDVGNEVSHHFIKHLHEELKAIKEDIYLLGEIWVDSHEYLNGDEYDSVMNYPFMQSVCNFFKDKDLGSADFRKKMDYCYSQRASKPGVI